MSKLFSKIKWALFAAVCGAMIFCGGGCNDFSSRESVEAGRPILGGIASGDIDPDIFFGTTQIGVAPAWPEDNDNDTGTIKNGYAILSNAGSEWMSLVITYSSACDISDKTEMKITGYTSGEVTSTDMENDDGTHWLTSGKFSVDFWDANGGVSRGDVAFSPTESTQTISLASLTAGDEKKPEADMSAIKKIQIYLNANSIGGNNKGGGKVYIKSIEFE